MEDTTRLDPHDFLNLCHLARQVSSGQVSLSQATDVLDQLDRETLLQWLPEGRKELDRMIREHVDELPFRHAFFELGVAAAMKVEAPLEFVNYAMNLGRMLCSEINDIDRGIELMEHAMQQEHVIAMLEPTESALLIVEVSDAYATFHRRKGEEYLKTATKGYRVASQILDGREEYATLLARAETGIGFCLAEVWKEGRMIHADEAVQHYEMALQHLDMAEEPGLYSLVLHHLGNACRHRESGDRSEDLRRAAECLRSALNIRESIGDEAQIRVTCSSLAEVERERGHPLQGISLYERAIETLDPIRQRSDYARFHLRLAFHCIQGSHFVFQTREHQKLARASYVVAREASDPDLDADEWAAASAGLAMAWYRSNMLDEAIALQKEVLGHLCLPEHAKRCARITLDYLQLLSVRIQRYIQMGDLRLARVNAAHAWSSVDRISQEELPAQPRLLLDAAVASINALLAESQRERREFRLRQCALLNEVLASAPTSQARQEIETIENLLISASSEFGTSPAVISIVQKRLARETEFLEGSPSFVDYHNFCEAMRESRDTLISVLLDSSCKDSAFAASDLARARTLDLIHAATTWRIEGQQGADLKSYLPSEFLAHHRELVEEWRANADLHDVGSGQRRDGLAPWIRESLQKAANWRGHWIVDCEPQFEEPDLRSVAFHDEPTALIEFWCAQGQACAFVKLPDIQELEVVKLPGLAVERQRQWLSEWFELYGDYERRGVAAVPKWARLMQDICRELGEACWGPLYAVLGDHDVDRLVIVPDMWLNSLPLHAMLNPANLRERLCDLYDIGFSPSARQLVRSLPGAYGVLDSILFVGDPHAVCPTGTCHDVCRLALPQASEELGAIRDSWPDVEALTGTDCTPTGVLQRLGTLQPAILHVSTHGRVRFEDPLGAGLVLALDNDLSADPLVQYVDENLDVKWGMSMHGEILSLDDLLRKSDLSKCRLAVLNACEVGLNYIGAPRESLGLAAGILAAGVPTVIGPIWPITEPVAMLLTRRIYAELREAPNQKLRALMRAQRWVRSLAFDDARGLVPKRYLKAGVALSGKDAPFSHPFFWACYQLIGNPH